jgi:hypothetical protein
MDSWRRRHYYGGGITLALAIWLNGRCEASVYESPGRCAVSERVTCDTTDEAKVLADELLKTAYPHDCAFSRCDPWVRLVQRPRPIGRDRDIL